MIDIKKIREDFDSTVAQLARRGVEQEKVAKARDLDAKRRTLLAETETLKAKRNAASKEIGALAKSGGDISAAKAEMRKPLEQTAAPKPDEPAANQPAADNTPAPGAPANPRAAAKDVDR